MNVILYCRVSTDEQADGCSLDMQELYLKRYCDSNDCNIIDIYKEDYSAKHYDMRRPEMAKMYEYCKKHKREVDKVLFLRWDRYSRNVEFAFAYKRKFYDELGIEINAIENPIDFSATEWSTLLALYCGVAHTEDEKISKRTRDGIHGSLLKGKCANKAPRGYKNHRISKHETYVVVDKGVAPLISKIFNEVAKGIEAPCKIRRRLCPNIAESSFLEMLRNPFYIGKIRVPAYRDDPEQIVEGLHEAIVSEEVFYRVQDVLDGKRKNTPKLTKVANPDLYLRKFLVCPVCGHSITGSESKGNGGKYAYYHCCHNGKHIRKRADDVNEGFARYVSCLTPNSEVLNLYKEILSDIRNEQGRETRNKVKDLLKEVRRVEDMRNTLDDKFLSGTISDDNYNRISQRYEKQINDLKQQIEIMKNLNRSNIEPKLSYSISLLDNMEGFIREAPVKVKIKLLGSIFPQKIEFDGKNYRTNGYNKVLDLIFQQTKELREPKKVEGERFSSFPASVPRAGVEPARVAPLVFETSASTDSAIWAFAGAKIHVFSELPKLLGAKVLNSFYLTIFKE